MSNFFAICVDEISFLWFKVYNRLNLIAQPKNSNSSDSENTSYVVALNQILNSNRKFLRFRKSYKYKAILEHLNYKQGVSYLSILQNRQRDVSALSQMAVRNDSVGGPRIFKFNRDLTASPTTLRYLKVSSDLELLFGTELGTVAEIGAGYGGQAAINLQAFSIDEYHIFDLLPAQALMSRYLERLDLQGRVFMTDLQRHFDQFDLVISNYAFSELPKELQQVYCERVLNKSRMGYLTMNSGKINDTGRSVGKMSLSEIQEYLPNSEILNEVPLTGPDNYILVWGQRR